MDLCQWFWIIPLGLIPRPGISIQCISTYLCLLVPITKIFSKWMIPMCIQTSGSRKQAHGALGFVPHPLYPMLRPRSCWDEEPEQCRCGGWARGGGTPVWVYDASGHILTLGQVSKQFPVARPCISHQASRTCTQQPCPWTLGSPSRAVRRLVFWAG